MRIPLSKILAIPFIIGFAIFLYLAYTDDTRYGIYIVPFVVALVAIYFLQPAIDWWWYQRNPPDVEAPLKRIFEKNLPFYQRLSDTNRNKFRERVALYIEANDFRPMVIEDVPEDVKGAVAANVIQLTFGQEDYLLAPFERIVLYPGVFPTPQYLEAFHASEVYEEDGVLLFAIDHLMPGTFQSQQYFNIGIYEYAKVFRINHPTFEYPKLSPDVWQDFERISGFPKEKVEGFVGLKDLDLWATSVTLFFSFPEKFKTILPDLYQLNSNIFNQDPTASQRTEAIKI